MGDFITFLQGKKTYVVAFLAAATAGAQALGYHVPNWVYMLEGALGLATVRVAISKNGGNYVTGDQVDGPLVPPSL
jgi:hypothetical protein